MISDSMRLWMGVSRCVPRMGCFLYLHMFVAPARRGPKDLGERQPLPSALWTPSPLRGPGCGPGPGAGGEMHFLARNEDAKRPRRRYRTRLWVRGLDGMWYFYRHAVRSAAPGLRWRFARPRPSGRLDWDVGSLVQSLRGCTLFRKNRWGSVWTLPRIMYRFSGRSGPILLSASR